MAAHLARINWDDDRFWFVSLDGDVYLEIHSPEIDGSDEPFELTAEQEDDVARELEGGRLRYTRSWIDRNRFEPNRTVTFYDPE